MMIHEKFKLVNGKPVLCKDLFEWGIWMGSSAREEWHWETFEGGYRISTVFLGLDHNFDEGPPILWETMVFNQKFGGRPFGEWPPREDERNDKLHQYMDRCAGGAEQAEAMHERMVEHVKETLSVREETT